MKKTVEKWLNGQTSINIVRLVGTFAKLDYLLKEHDASRHLRRMANDLRVRLRRLSLGEVEIHDLKEHWTADVEALSLLVQLLFRVPVPHSLASAFHVGGEAVHRTSALSDCMRMIVTRWDDDSVFGTLANDGVDEVRVCYARGGRNNSFDRSYLKDLFCEGMQLNLIRPKLEQGVLYPELIIVEPDYLVDISTVAGCFTAYAESPLVALMKRLEPAEPTAPILLGGLASQFLDEELHGEQRPYADCALDFFRANALNLLTTSLGSAFHDDARKQRANIHNAISCQLPSVAARYDKASTVVEPSFISEMLGLQGRMDFLQLDMRVLIEQKSGKAEFVPRDPTPDVPRQKEEHYVQMLLYMAILRYNYSEQYERNHHELHAFLLYSRYPQSLLGLGFAPELLFRAFRLRNRLVVQDLELARKGFGLLLQLTPDLLNEKGLSSRLWTDYVRPRLQTQLSILRQASERERLYCLRMLKFVAAEHEFEKLGNKTKENSGFASLWQDSLDDKLSAGSIYEQLELAEPVVSGQKVQNVVLRFHEREANDMSNFRVGDIVILYPYAPGTQPDARRTMVFRGTIASITLQELVIRLRNAQTDSRVFLRDRGKHWAVEHDLMEAQATAQYRGILAFLSAPLSRRRLLMAERLPEVDESRLLRGDYGPFNTLALKVKQAKDLFLIIGPPGTGKTSYGMFNTLQEELLEDGASVLVMAFTNRAVDEICSKLHGKVDFVRIGAPLACSGEYHEHLFSEKVASCSNVSQLSQLVQQTKVFVGTTAAFCSAQALFKLKSFSLAIVDEASQILEPHLLPLLSARHADGPAIRKFVMIGDHKQLPAVVQQRPSESEVAEPQLKAMGLTNCRLSLFERLLRLYGKDSRFCYMLTRQGRMHPDISEFPNKAFYGGRLQAVPLPHQQLPSSSRRVTFLDVKALLSSPSDKVNLAEAEVIASCAQQIYQREKVGFSPQETIGIIVPYRNQIATIRSTIDRLGVPQLHDITIDTVERYQGSQRKYIIYGFTIQQYYQLRFLTDSTFLENGAVIDRKLNVAMTRAQEYLILVGNASLLARNAVFSRLIDFVKQKGGYMRSE